MISFEEALQIVTSNIPTVAFERVPFREAVGRILAEDILSDMPMPPFDKAAVDGYACRKHDTERPLECIEIIPAGAVPVKHIQQGCCSKIMTGSMVPAGADCVVMVENTIIDDQGRVLVVKAENKSNIAYKAEDIQKGACVITKGTKLATQHIAVLAAVGAVEPLVYKKVRVAVLSTGDELVEPEVFPATGKIRNSNSSQLVAQIQGMGADAVYLGIVADNAQHTREMISKALSDAQVAIFSGGISMGDFDFVPEVIEELGLEISFKTIAVQPGKPTVFARSDDRFVMALPGNPVSSFNIFELLAKPFLYRLMGHMFQPAVIKLPLGVSYSRKAIGRLGFVPVSISSDGKLFPIGYHGSAHISALVDAHGLMAVPLGIAAIEEGAFADVRLI